MSKKYIIIMAAACIVSLGIGVLIGGGFNESNLSATAAGDSKAIQEAMEAYLNGDNDTDVLYLAVSGMEAKLSEFAARSQKLIEKKKAARTILSEIREILSEGSLVMTDDVFSSLRDLTQTGDDEVLEAIFRDLEAMLSCKPGDTLSTAQWEAIEAEVKDIINSLSDVSDLAQFDLQKVYQDYQQAVNTLAAVLKQ